MLLLLLMMMMMEEDDNGDGIQDGDSDMIVDEHDAFVMMDSLLLDDNAIAISSICMLVSTS